MNESSMAKAGKSLLYKVYGLMGVALAITAGVAFYIATDAAIMQTLFHNPWLMFGIFIVQLILVVVLSAAIMRLSFPVALMLLIAYSILMGLTLSAIFIIYPLGSIYTAFVVAAGMFACMGLYGYFTKADLTVMGSYTMMALFGLIIGFLVNMFLKSSAVDYILTLVGVVVFTLLTAYDVQKIKQLGIALAGQGEAEKKIVVVGALTLYLDFINLFLMLLRLMGRRNSD